MKNSNRTRRRASAGFTLVELMVTVMIVGVLAAIAVPSYQKQVLKSRRTDAKTALLDLATREERYYSTHNAYTSAPANLGYSGTFPVSVGSGYYNININVCTTASGTPPCGTDAGTGTSFSATATALNNQTKDTTCGNFGLDSTGLQSVTGSASATPSTCWN